MTTVNDQQQAVDLSRRDWLLSLLSDWIPEDNDAISEAEKEEEDLMEHSEQNDEPTTMPLQQNPSAPDNNINDTTLLLSPLELLAPDLSARVLQHLTVQEIVTVVATVSRTMHAVSQCSDLWRLKFVARWNLGEGEGGEQSSPPDYHHNYSSSSSSFVAPSSHRFSIKDWYQAYRQAYENIDDLWITHWNCLYPSDGLAPGRCCVQEEEEKQPSHDESSSSSSSSSSLTTNNINNMDRGQPQLHRFCPNCRSQRYRQGQSDPISSTKNSTTTFTPKTISTLAQAIAAATSLRLQQEQQRLETTIAFPYTTRKAHYAFANAATLHRTISTQQYQANSLFFLKDLLFFQVHYNRKELEDLKHCSLLYDQRQDEAVSQSSSINGATSSTTNAEQEPQRPPPPPPQHSTSQRSINHSHHHHSRNTMDSCHTAMHSWHMVQFTNPDYIRPLVWRIAIQRPDCFTVFPSEGFLQPGETTTVTFGVKPLASFMAHAMHQLNAHREGVDEFWASVYTDEAHLPAVPFLIHYHFTGVIPCRPPDDQEDTRQRSQRRSRPQEQHRGNAPPANSVSPTHQSFHRGSLVDLSPWQQQQQASRESSETQRQGLRSIYLSAHVNGNFPLYEFWRSTLVPFDLETRQNHYNNKQGKCAGVVYCAPQLHELYPTVWSRLENLDLECDEHSSASRRIYYRTEPPCLACKTRWGARREELGQAHILALLECQVVQQQRNMSFRRMVQLLRYLVVEEWRNNSHIAYQEEEQDSDNGLVPPLRQDARRFWTERQQHVLYAIHKRLVDVRGAPWLSPSQREVLLQWEVVVDKLCYNACSVAASTLTVGQENEQDTKTPWRHAGVYRHPLCTDSVFSRGTLMYPKLATAFLGKEGKDEYRGTLWKEEPCYLKAFAHLVHSPGRFNLGPQEDPNHLQRFDPSNRFGRRQEFVSDVFMDDPMCGIQAALCVLHDPSSLMVHGIYDRIPYPGTLVRRPKLPVLRRLDPKAYRERLSVNLPPFLVSPGRMAYFQLQNALDMEALVMIDSWCSTTDGTRAPKDDCLSRSKRAGFCTSSSSLQNYLSNTPPPGMGRVPLCNVVEDAGSSIHGNTGDRMMTGQIVELAIETDTESPTETAGDRSMNWDSSLVGQSLANNFHVGQPHVIDEGVPNINNRNPRQHDEELPAALRRRPLALNLLWILSAHLGWTVDDNQGPASVFVDRRILIGAQWFSISLMAAPLFLTLFARYALWIPARPVDYALQALPFDIDSEMRCEALRFF
jgi:hypothetical protein